MSYLPWEHTLLHSDSIGVAIPGGRFHLIDESGETIEASDVAGELVYTGPNVMMGYASAPEELALPAGPDERSTGDLAERDALGLYRIVGRLSRFSKIMGLRISLDEVEEMAKRSGAGDSAVAGNDEIVGICVRAGSVDAAALEATVSTECGIPLDTVVVVEVEEGIPRLHSGKVDYVSIIEEAKSIAETRQSQNESLRDEIAGMLGRETLADDESFSSLGGDSLTYIQASFAIERRLGHLPPSWENLPISTLEAFESGASHSAAAGSGAEVGRSGRMIAVDMDVLLRALAITAVVYNHSRPTGIPPLQGAMAVLLMAVGQNLARFRSDSLFRGEGLALIRSTFARYMLPYLGILALYLLAKGRFDLPSLLLVSTFVDPRAGTFLEPFWFIEVFFHVMLVLAGIFSIPPLRSAIAANPLAWGAGAVATLGTLHLTANQLQFLLPPLVLWSGVVGLGWCVHFAQTRTARILLSLSAVTFPWLMPRGFVVGIVLVLVIWIPRAPLYFAGLKNFVGRIGAASFQIYILHAVILTLLGVIPSMRGSWLFPTLGIPLSLIAGVAFNAVPWRTWLPGRQSGSPANSIGEF